MKVWKWMNIWPKKMPRLVITRRMSLLHTLLMASAKEGTTQACPLPSCLSQSLGTSVIHPASASHCAGDHPSLPPPPPPGPAFDLQIWSLNSRWFYCSLKSSKIPTLPLPSPWREKDLHLWWHAGFLPFVQILYNAGENKWGTDEDKFTEILCLRSFPQLKLSMTQVSCSTLLVQMSSQFM